MRVLLLALVLGLGLLPGPARADQPDQSDLLVRMGGCSPLTKIGATDDNGVTQLHFEFSPLTVGAFSPEEFRTHDAALMPNRFDLYGNAATYYHPIRPGIVLVFARIPLRWATENVEEALRESFERGMIVSCFRES